MPKVSVSDAEELAKALSGGLSNSKSFHLPKQAIDLIYELFASIYTRNLSDEEPIEQYLAALRIFLKESSHPAIRNAIDEIHGALVIHLVRLIHANGVSSGPALEQLGRLIWTKPSPISHKPTISVILKILQKTWRTWNGPYRQTFAYAYIGIMRGTDHLRGGKLDWAEWRTCFYIGLDIFMESQDPHLVASTAQNETRKNEKKSPFLVSQVKRMSRIKDPIISLYASLGVKDSTCPPSTPPVETSRLGDWYEALGYWCISKEGDIDITHSEAGVIFSYLSACDQGTSEMNLSVPKAILWRFHNIQTFDRNSMSSIQWSGLLQIIPLHIILRTLTCPEFPLTHLFSQLCRYSWFRLEFIWAGGLNWLAHPNRDSGGSIFISRALEIVTLWQDVEGWANVLWHMLARRSSSKRRFPRNYLKEVIESISEISDAQESHRKSSELGLCNAVNSVGGPSSTKPHSYVRDWSEQEWNEWVDLKNEVVDGMRRGFISYGPPILSRFARDPNGICSPPKWSEMGYMVV